MAYGLNNVQIIGRLGAEPEEKAARSGKALTVFRVAVNARGADGETTEWFNIVAWEKLAKTCHEHLRKGDRVYIAGRLQSRRYTDRDGVERTAYEIVARDLVMLGGRGGDSSAAPFGAAQDKARRGRSAQRPATGDIDLDDVPF